MRQSPAKPYSVSVKPFQVPDICSGRVYYWNLGRTLEPNRSNARTTSSWVVFPA